MFSCEFCKISKNTFSYRTPPVASSVNEKLMKSYATFNKEIYPKNLPTFVFTENLRFFVANEFALWLDLLLDTVHVTQFKATKNKNDWNTVNFTSLGSVERIKEPYFGNMWLAFFCSN